MITTTVALIKWSPVLVDRVVFSTFACAFGSAISRSMYNKVLFVKKYSDFSENK